MTDPVTPDLVAALEAIEKRAREARLRLAAGGAVNGHTALRDVELEARWALAHQADRTSGADRAPAMASTNQEDR